MPSATKSVFNRFIHRVWSQESLGLFSARTVIILVCLIYLFLGPISTHIDIVSAAVAYGILAVVGALALYVTIPSLLLKRALRVTLAAQSGELVSKSPVAIVVATSQIRLLPLLNLFIKVVWKEQGAPSSIVRFVGRGLTERFATITPKFPHRGVWKVHKIVCTTSDFLGLIQMRWALPSSFSLEITPPQIPEPNLPIISSSQRPGDLVTDTLNREGDHYDIKRYHPSDGIKKIVWKVFAKRGDLLSRHPEASITPEGYVLLYICADKFDDNVVARAVAYTTQLSDLNLDVVGTCEGANSDALATSAASLMNLCVDSVWNVGADTTSAIHPLRALIESAQQRDNLTKIDKVVVFCSEQRLSTPSGEATISAITTYLGQQNISPVIIVSKELTPSAPKRGVTTRLVRSVMLTQDKEKQVSPASKENYERFVARCLQNRWEVLV